MTRRSLKPMTLRSSLLPSVITVLLLLGWAFSAHAQQVSNAHSSGDNPVFEDLVREGLRLDADTIVTLPEPSLVDNLDGDRQRAIVTRISGRYGWKAFVRKSSVAPFVLRQAYLKNKNGDRIGHQIDLWFIAFGQLADLQDDKLAEDFFGSPRKHSNNGSGARVRELDEAELKRLGASVVDKDVDKYVLAEVPLMNRVHVQGVARVYRSMTEQSSLVAWKLVAATNQDDDLSNRWYPMKTTKLGSRERGAAHLYQGYGGYLKITRLAAPQAALFFETHVVFHEPQEWFHGSNLLRSKTPLVVREYVDKLRRKLGKAQR